MVSKASEDLPEPLNPVMTTSLSRGMLNVRFLRLCSRAPPILMNSLLTDPNFANPTIPEPTGNPAGSKEILIADSAAKYLPVHVPGEELAAGRGQTLEK